MNVIFSKRRINKLKRWETWISNFPQEYCLTILTLINGGRSIFHCRMMEKWTIRKILKISKMFNVIEVQTYFWVFNFFQGQLKYLFLLDAFFKCFTFLPLILVYFEKLQNIDFVLDKLVVLSHDQQQIGICVFMCVCLHLPNMYES